MSGTGRRRSPRRASTAAAVPPVEAVAPAIEAEVELLDDRSTPITGARAGRSLGRSLPGAIAGTLLVVGLAFGAALGAGNLGPASDREAAGDTAAGDGVAASPDGGDDWRDGSDATAKPDEPDGDHPEATKQPDGDHPDATDKPDAEPTAKPTEKPVDKPDATPKPTEKPDATKPPLEHIALGLGIKEYHPVVEWGSCSGLDFDAYKVVRSTNSTVSWPLGEGDALIGVVEPGGNRRAYDGEAPHGMKLWYRVFCVRHTEDGYKVLNSSVTKGIDAPEEPVAPPPPDPITLGLEASLLDGGKVRLDWSACEVDGFAAYKVVRSTTNDDPSYLPSHDGTEVIGVVSEVGATMLDVWAPDGAGTAWYRVQCIGYLGDQKVLLGESAVVEVTVP